MPTVAAGDESSNDLVVVVGRTSLVETTWPIKKIHNNLAEIAEVFVTSPTEIEVQGKKIGDTSLILWDTHGGRQFYNISVRASKAAEDDALEAVRRELKMELPGQPIKVTADGDALFLRGTVNTLGNSKRAVEIAKTGGKKDVVNLLSVNVPDSDPQILLKVRFMSVDRNKATEFGMNIFSVGALNTVGGISTGVAPPPVITGGGNTPITVQTQLGTNLNIMALPIGNLPMGSDARCLGEQGNYRVLAEPNLLASNGKQASFLAGGEYPYPIVQGGGAGTAATVTIMFKEYGVRLSFIPTITPRGTIRLQVAPEVSALDFSDAVEISGFEVPAITTRKVKTEVELADGQSFVIGGLLDNTESETFQKIPFLGDIPVLGKFFQSMQKTKANTELIVIVTPEIVAPIPAGAPTPDLKLPAKFLPPNSGIPMNTPDAKTAANTPTPPPPTMPVEKLVDSLKPETPLSVAGESTTFGSGSAASQ